MNMFFLVTWQQINWLTHTWTDLRPLWCPLSQPPHLFQHPRNDDACHTLGNVQQKEAEDMHNK